MDQDLVVRAQEGDHEAFARLVDGTAHRLHGIAQGILRDRSLAEDATQQALLEIWRDLPLLREPQRFEAWAGRILVRACHAQARRGKGWVPPPPDIDVVDDAATARIHGIADRDELERAFQRLSFDHRTVVILHHFADLSISQVAATLDIPVDTVRSRLYHAIRGLRAALDADRRPAISLGAVRARGQELTR
jgi:RNA polymerase sigma-70 factor (ECF subfamily)